MTSTVSLHVLAKNAENVIGRLLGNIGPFVDTASFVLNDTFDGTRAIIERWAAERNVRLRIIDVTYDTNPEFYILDTARTYEGGRPLAGEAFKGPFTEKPLLADWAAARNLGWESDADWRLMLDADDVVIDPQSLPSLIELAEKDGADVVATKSVYGRNAQGIATKIAYRERLARKSPVINWRGATHEVLGGGLRLLCVDNVFAVVDLKDNVGDGVRVPGRCFKVLYHEARMRSWKVPSRHLAYLVQEAPGLMASSFITGPLATHYFETADDKEEMAWVSGMLGELCEKEGELEDAAVYYDLAGRCYASSNSSFRLARICYLQGRYAECVSAWNTAQARKPMRQLLDVNAILEAATSLLVAESLFVLGETRQARVLIDKSREIFPDDANVVALWRRIHGKD